MKRMERREKYDAFVNSYNYEREHGGINGMTPAEKFMKCLKQPILTHQNKTKSVSHVSTHLFVNHVWKYNI